MTMLRMLLPWIVAAVALLAIGWFIAIQAARNSDQQDRSYIYKGARIISYFVVMLLFIRIITMGSVNEVPRSVIDRTIPVSMKENFEERMKKDASLPKQCDSTIRNCK